jgi:endonuclease YncB( thermonuclease family)
VARVLPLTLFLAVFLGVATQGFADVSGLVVKIFDGDTLEVLHSQHPERLRLHGIDGPEKGQAYGQKAKQATSESALDRNRNHHGQIMCEVWTGVWV